MKIHHKVIFITLLIVMILIDICIYKTIEAKKAEKEIHDIFIEYMKDYQLTVTREGYELFHNDTLIDFIPFSNSKLDSLIIEDNK